MAVPPTPTWPAPRLPFILVVPVIPTSPLTDNVEPAQDGKWFFGQGNWAKIEQKQFDSLVEHMRMIHGLKQSGKLYSNSSGIETAIKYSWENTCAKTKYQILGAHNI